MAVSLHRRIQKTVVTARTHDHLTVVQDVPTPFLQFVSSSRSFGTGRESCWWNSCLEVKSILIVEKNINMTPWWLAAVFTTTSAFLFRLPLNPQLAPSDYRIFTKLVQVENIVLTTKRRSTSGSRRRRSASSSTLAHTV